MFKHLGRNNQLFMLSNFIFALSFGLWFNLRPLFLADMGASPAQIGLALAVGGIAAGIIPLPAGIISDRIGPRRVIIFSWMLALLGAAVMAIAPSWQMVTVGILIANLTWAANPAVTSFVMLSMPDNMLGDNSERALSTVFRVWPAAMIIAPAMGGWLADLFTIRVDLWISVVGFVLSMSIMWLTTEVKSEHGTEKVQFGKLGNNKNFWIIVFFFGLLSLAYNVGFTLLPNFLEEVRGFSQGTIGILFSMSFVGTLFFNLVIERIRPRKGFLLLITVPLIGLLILWSAVTLWGAWAAFFLFGGITTMWIIKMASIGRIVQKEVQGVAFGIAESATFLFTSVASGMAGVFYGMTSGHEMPLIAGIISLLLVFLIWYFYVRRVTGEPPI